MMEKPKRKNDEPGVWGKLSDVILFAKRFEYEVGGSPADCTKQLKRLEAFERGFLKILSQNVTVTPVHNQTYDFEVSRQRYGRNLKYYTARAQGIITMDKGIETTVVRGKLRLGRVILFGLVGIFLEILVIAVLLPELIEAWWFFVLFIGSHVAFLLLQVADYGKLDALLRDTLAPESQSKKKNDETE